MTQALDQMRVLLWRDLVRRKRKPLQVFLELLWPILVFVVVVLVRRGSLPKYMDTCRFKPWVMPTTGGLEFMQSYLCNLNNECRKNTQFDASGVIVEPRATSLRDSLKELFDDGSGVIVDLLPKAAHVVDRVKVVLQESNLAKLLQETVTLRELLGQNDFLYETVVVKLELISPSIATYILDAEIEILALPIIFDSYTDLKKKVCTPEVLGQFLKLNTNKVTIEEVSEALCYIDHDHIPGITAMMQSNTDIPYILDTFEQAYMDTAFGMIAGLNNAQGLFNVFFNLNGVVDFEDQYPDLAGAINWVNNASGLFDELEYAATQLPVLLNQITSGKDFNLMKFFADSGISSRLKTSFEDLFNMIFILTEVDQIVQGTSQRPTDLNGIFVTATTQPTTTTEPVYTLETLLQDPQATYDTLRNEFDITRSGTNIIMSTEIPQDRLDYLVDRLRFVDPLVVFCINPGYSSMFRPADRTARALIDDLQFTACRYGLSPTGAQEFNPFDEIYHLKFPPPETTTQTVPRTDFYVTGLGNGGVPTSPPVVDFGPFLDVLRENFGENPSENSYGGSWSIVDVLETLQDLGDANQKVGKFHEMSQVLQLALTRGAIDIPIYVEFQDILLDSESMANFIMDGLGQSPNLTNAVLESSINMELLTLVLGGGVTVADILCDASTLAMFILFNDDTHVDMIQLSAALCGALQDDASEQIAAAIDLGALVQTQIERLPPHVFNESWWGQRTDLADNILDGVSGAIDALNLLTYLSQEKYTEALQSLAELISKTFDVMGGDGYTLSDGQLDRIEELMVNVEDLLQDEVVRDFLSDIGRLGTSLIKTDFTKTHLIVNMLLRDALKEPDVAYDYMVDTVGLAPDITAALIGANITIDKALSISDVGIFAAVCSADMLSQLLDFKADVNPVQVVNELCAINGQELKDLLQVIMEEAEIGPFLKYYMDLSPTYLMYMANLTDEEVQIFVDLMGPLTDKMSEIMTVVENITASVQPDPDIYNLTGMTPPTPSQIQTYTAQAMASTLCGHELADSMNNDSALNMLASSDLSDNLEIVWTDDHKQEMDALGDPYCIDLYKQINSQGVSGPVIWRSLKPLFRGQILYTPDTPATRGILKRVAKFVSSVYDTNTAASAWLVGLESVKQLLDIPELEGVDLSEMLDNRMIRSAIGQFSGIDMNKFKHLISSNPSDVPSVGGLSDLYMIVQLLKNITGCFGVNIIPMKSEEDMEQFASSLQATNDLLAGIVFPNMYDPYANFTEQDWNSGKRRKREASPQMYELPKHIRYKLRMDQEFVRKSSQKTSFVYTPGPEDSFIEELRYLRGFMLLQNMIDTGIVEMQTDHKVDVPNVNLHQMPHPCWEDDLFQFYGSYVLSVILVFAWLCVLAIAITAYVSERETGILAAMQVMGLKQHVRFLAWFVNTMGAMLVMAAVITAVMYTGQLIRFTDPLFMYCIFVAYSLSITMFGYMMSIFFTRTTLAALVGIMTYLVLCLPYVVIYNSAAVGYIGFNGRLAMCLATPSAFLHLIQDIMYFEQTGSGSISFNEITTRMSSVLTPAWAFGAICVDGVIFAILGWFFSNIFYGPQGGGQPVYFLLTKKYWGIVDREETYRYSDYGRRKSKTTADEVPGEPDPDLPVGISINRLTKAYSKKAPPAVDNISVNFYQGQVTAFLGHNGAGKTSTFGMLSGIRNPTSGKIHVDGRDTSLELPEVRQILGFCPQYDILIDFLTIEEHLNMYLAIKGNKSGVEDKEEKQRILTMTGLLHIKKARACHLSGGQRRRLSVALAFLGGSKVVLLDEPTSGVDPGARRNIWDIIVAHRDSRTILLSTHHLDEAEVIGDRIVMIHQGKIMCTGSPMFLKNYFGSGYHLTVAKADMDRTLKSAGKVIKSDSDDDSLLKKKRQADDILELLRAYVPESKLVEEIGTEMRFVLPYHGVDPESYQMLFQQLDDQQERLNIHKYGISATPIEEVFLKVTHMAERGEPLDPVKMRNWTIVGDMHGGDGDQGMGDRGRSAAGSRRSSISAYTSDDYSSYDGSVRGSDNLSYIGDTPNGSSNYLYRPHKQQQPSVHEDENETKMASYAGKERLTGATLKRRQFRALMTKRVQHNMRNKLVLISQIIMPCLFVVITMFAGQLKPAITKALSSLNVSPEIYSPNVTTLFRLDDYTPMAMEMLETLQTSGQGTTCMPDSETREELCVYDYNIRKWIYPRLTLAQNHTIKGAQPCKCDPQKVRVCEDGSEGYPAPYFQTPTSTKILNITSVSTDYEEYVLKNHHLFTFLKYGRYGGQIGGWGFGKDTPKEKVTATVWFNNRAWHAMPGYYNQYSNMLLRSQMPTDEQDEYGITMYNHPFNKTSRQLNVAFILQGVSDTGVTLLLMAALAFVPPGFTTYLINERINKEKRLQYICGVTSTLYWCTAFLWDMINYMITVGILVLIALGFNIPMYVARQNFSAFVALMSLFGWANIPLMYLMVPTFDNAKISYMVLFLFNLFVGVNTTASTFFFSFPIFNDKSTIQALADTLSYGFLVTPAYCLGDGLLKMGRNQFVADVFAEFGLDVYDSPFVPKVALWHMVAMAIQGIVFFSAVLIIESPLFHGRAKRNTGGRLPDYKEDSDVSLERQRVITGDAKDDAFVMHGLGKVYRRGFQKIRAVDNLCVGIPKGECFGLLGINGAGKTTTFKMITGDVKPSSGGAILNGKVISDDTELMDQEVGYCPQFDALDDLLTGKQMLFFYARLKGIPEEDIPAICETATKMFGLEKHINKRTQAYSGGNKRKLSTAIALLGDPQLILLDEPTSGMDPATRRLVWNNITKVIKDNRSLILTSHSMAECDALCTKMAIMVNGTFMCLGSGQHLKNKFGSGYTAAMRAAGNPPNIPIVMEIMTQAFPGAMLKDRHLRQLEFEVPKRACKLSSLFRVLEKQKRLGIIEDYSVTQTTLDQVFLHFARRQNDARMTENDSDDEYDEDDDGTLSHISNISGSTLSSLLSIISKRKTFRRGKSKPKRRGLDLPPGTVKGFSFDDWAYRTDPGFLDEIKNAPSEEPECKEFIKELLNTKLPTEAKGMDTDKLAEYLGPDICRALREKTKRFRAERAAAQQHQQRTHPRVGPNRTFGAGHVPPVLRRAMQNVDT